jgi:glycogen debranching enzyme
MPTEAAAKLKTTSETLFYNAAAGSCEQTRRVLKHGDTFAVFDSYGDIGSMATGEDGLFHRDTRHLSRFELTLNGIRPLLLGSNVRDDNVFLTVDLTNPDIYLDGHLTLPKDTVHLVRSIFLWDGSIHQRIAVRNFGEHPVVLTLSLVFASDFVDLFEVRGMRRAKRGAQQVSLDGTRAANAVYKGLDGRMRQTSVTFGPEPTVLSKNLASFAVSLDPDEQRTFYCAATCSLDAVKQPVRFFKAMRASLRDRKRQTSGVTTVETSNDIFNEILCRSAADLDMLVTRTSQGRYPYAGIPWYSTTFGRDGLITALELLWRDPFLARGVLRRLAARQAMTYDRSSDAEPGKILHEMRGGEMAALGEVPFSLYFGSVDATPLFVMLACLYTERTGDETTLRELWPNIEAALGWTDGPGDKDGDGFIEYHRATEQGLANQGWKDSHDAIFHADGRLAEGPIALCEVQGYVFAAKRLAARAARSLGRFDHAEALDAQATKLADLFDAAFWRPHLGCYALALDGDKQPCDVRTSNAGHALFTGIARPERAAVIASAFMDHDFFSGWGIRTVARKERRYNPMSYHNGSIWPHDNALIALGLARYGRKHAVERVFHGLFEAAVYMELRRLPELFCGFNRSRGRGPTLYPVACSPQAWAAATPFALVQASLGLEFDSVNSEIRLRNPRLPSFIDEMTIRNLSLAAAQVDLALHRHGDEVSVRVIRSKGEVQVSALYG